MKHKRQKKRRDKTKRDAKLLDEKHNQEFMDNLEKPMNIETIDKFLRLIGFESMLPANPEKRIRDIQELLEAELIRVKEAEQLLDMPDVDIETDGGKLLLLMLILRLMAPRK